MVIALRCCEGEFGTIKGCMRHLFPGAITPQFETQFLLGDALGESVGDALEDTSGHLAVGVELVDAND